MKKILLTVILLFTISVYGADKAAQVEIVRKLNALAEQLFTMSLRGESNTDVAIQPLSLAQTLLALYANADGETANEISALLTLTNNEIIFAEKIIAGVFVPSIRPQSAWWLSERFTWSAQQPQILSRDYAAVGVHLDFYTNPERAFNAINNWYKQMYKLPTTSSLPADNILTTTQLLITNGAMFTFNQARGEIFSARLFYGENFSAVELDITNHQRLTILLPKNDLSICEKTWSLINFGDWQQLVKLTLADWALSIKRAWRDDLRKLGMETAFSELADFRKLSPEKPQLQNIFQETNIVLTENATAKIAGNNAQEFMVDKPFIFMVRDKNTNLILALGRVVTPFLTVSEKTVEEKINFNGYGAWNLGVTNNDLHKTIGEHLRMNNESRWEIKTAQWGNDHDKRAEFVFTEDGKLHEIRLWLCENATRETAIKQLVNAENYLQKLGRNQQKFAEDLLTRIDQEYDKLPTIVSEEIKAAPHRPMNVKLSLIRHPQIGWQIAIIFTKE